MRMRAITLTPGTPSGTGSQISVGRLTLLEPTALVDIHDAELLIILEKHYLVRAALDAATGLGTSHTPARLDEGIIRLSGPIGRPHHSGGQPGSARVAP